MGKKHLFKIHDLKINIFEIISLQLSYLEKSVHQPAIS